MSRTLNTFLGTDRWLALWRAWCRVDQDKEQIRVPFYLPAISIVISLIPVGILYLESCNQQYGHYLSTMSFGLCAVMALLMRKRLGIKGTVANLKWSELSLTHTAVALGCLPAVCVVLVEPALLADRHDVLANIIPPVVTPGSAGQAVEKSYLLIFFTLIGISAWVSITEELIFRGLMLSGLRRVLPKLDRRLIDSIAVFLSALIFGLAHVPTWGIAAGIALFGLGIGFGIAYVVTDEKLLPVIGYHFVFDLCSLTLALLL